MRLGMRRFTRLTNAFSEKVENHAHSVAIHLMHYNFVRIHTTERHARNGGLGHHEAPGAWDMVKVLEEWEASKTAWVASTWKNLVLNRELWRPQFYSALRYPTNTISNPTPMSLISGFVSSARIEVCRPNNRRQSSWRMTRTTPKTTIAHPVTTAKKLTVTVAQSPFRRAGKEVSPPHQREVRGHGAIELGQTIHLVG
jgi:hypothetical protein